MDRALLEKILQKAPGVDRTESGYAIAEEHRASLYLGKAGATTTLAEIVRVALHESFVEAEARDRTVHFVSYEPVLGFSVRRPREDASRTGF